MAVYYPNYDEISLVLYINNEFTIYFDIDSTVDGSYSWSYFDDFGYKMSGTLYASTYDTNTLLGYSYNNISNSSIRTSVRKLASSMVSNLCSYISYDFSTINVTAEDLHFYYYS